MPIPRRTVGKCVFLVLLTAILGRILYTRGVGMQLGAPPAALHGPHATEEAWVVDEIVRDVTEMSAYPATIAKPSVAAIGGGRYRVAVDAAVIDLDLSDRLWAPERFAPLARVLRATRPPANVVDEPPSASAHAALLELTPAALVDMSRTTSRALKTHMRTAAPHEAAALIVGAFELRDAAGRFHDPRWALNRMTAHLAMAAACDCGSPGVDGRLAAALLLALSNDEARAIEALDAIAAQDRSPATDAWVRALRLRVTHDLRGIAAPADSTLLEKQEYYRAKRTAVTTAADAALAALRVEPSATWIRLTAATSVGVEDRWAIDTALAEERAEYTDVFRRMHGRAIDADSAAALNARATRCVETGDPDVLPWGAWAEFEQRQLALIVGKTDYFYRHTIGSAPRADTLKAQMNESLDRLAMFPLATLFRYAGVKGGEADTSFLNHAVAALLAAPERVTPAVWSFVEMATHYEPVRSGVPRPNTWFMAPSARVPHSAASRLKDGGFPASLPLLATLRSAAPYDFGLANEYLTVKYGQKAPPYDELRAAYGPLLEYDLRALRAAAGYMAEDEEHRLALLQASCEASAVECASLGAALARKDRGYEAARAYERAFAAPELDAVALSNWAGWLVTYYYDRGRTDAALDLAERAASTRAFQGLVTQAYLFERLGRLDEAEQLYSGAAERYDNPAQLLGFYYRTVVLHKHHDFEKRWNEARERVFPQGLVAVQSGDAKPQHGVIVVKDNKDVRAKGLQAGDIIVGLEGWRVENLQQYYAVNAFYTTDAMKLTVWRGRMFDVAIAAPGRLMGIQFRSYPIQGWAE